MIDSAREELIRDCELYARVTVGVTVVADDWKPGDPERREPRDTLLKAAAALRTPPLPDREEIALAICDGFTEGNEDYETIDSTTRIRFLYAADAILALREPVSPAIEWDANHNRSYEPVETRAKEIFDGFQYHGPGTKPAWVTGGNSTKQDAARHEARRQLREAGHAAATSPPAQAAGKRDAPLSARLQAAYDKVALWPDANPDTGWAELLILRNLVPETIRDLGKLTVALEEIADPIGAFAKRALDERAVLNMPMAKSMSDDPNYLKRIASRALSLRSET